MTYCVERTRLLAKAGRDLSTKLLPDPFRLWFSDHDTGIQMTIVLPMKGREPLTVWRGSIWHSHIYEFNDRGVIAGLQLDFEFARPVIDEYFDSVAREVEAREANYLAEKQKRDAAVEAEKAAAIASARALLVGGAA